jgi:predicted ATPase/class 3 adenylate cyclase
VDERLQGIAANDRRPLPTGAVTFVFTDIEGSTRLVEALGPERYGDVLDVHRHLLREAFAANGGIEVGTEGDSFFVVFVDPAAAVRATADAQRALDAASWPHGVATVRVRMGMHTGDGALASGTYVGAGVNRAARIGATAHGGQVVVSSATRQLVEDKLPAGTRLRDLGEHRLKDLTEPERIAQLVISGLPADFPPLRSLEAVPNNLPVQLTSFVGREDDIVAVAELLRTARLVTLTGPGGTGKTRLALQVAADIADRYRDGVWFVPLAQISDPDLVGSTIASAINVQTSGPRPIRDVLADFLRDRETLIVLDNFEQVAEAASLVGDLLREAPRLRVVVSSQTVLRLSGEHELPLDTLPVSDAVALFAERARAVRPDFELREATPVVIDIVTRLDGLPLAIELAAARSRLLSPAAMLARLDRRLDLLAADLRDLPPRQRTIRGAIDWSYDLLDADTARLFAHLSVFVGSARLDDIEAVLRDLKPAIRDVLLGLETLVEHSLVRRVEPGDGSRFTMLATIREYALERLAAIGEDRSVRDRHASHYLELAEEAAARLTGPEQVQWLGRVDVERDNVRAAIAHALAVSNSGLALRFCAALWRYWQTRGLLLEGMDRTREALALPGVDEHPAEHLAALEAGGGLAWWLADFNTCEDLYRQSLEAHLRDGDEAAIARARYNLSFPVAFNGRPDEALDLAISALEGYRRIGDANGVARSRWAWSIFALELNDLETSFRESSAAVAHFRATNARFDLAWAIYGVAQVAHRRGDLDEAEARYRETLLILYEASDIPGIAQLLDPLSAIAWRRGDVDRAARMAGTVARLEQTSGAGLLPQNRRRTGGYDPLPLRDDPTTAAAWADGEAMPLDEAVALALAGRG